ncbi:HEAT repeat protein [Trichostrongylus colubriformis]|uniref:HEAT repeat protein n=1 Tax=Trichostrongylus colubriformis TaxID=6319 RepID=A0AAN8F7Y2_TRICO
MVPLAEKLNFNNLNVELMKYLARLQGADEHGGIRTNTTICLGKIASYLDPSKRQMILLSAFARGMKDPFPPSRMAAVLALSATQQFYSLVEIANRVLPALSPLTCDPEKQVRDQAFKAIKGFMENLEKASEHPELIPEIESQVKAGGRSLLNSDKVPQWASWALKSLSGKFYKGNPPPEPRPTSSPDSSEASAAADRSTAAAPPSETKKSNQASPDDDGWGDLDNVADLGSIDEWADALEPPVPLKTDDDDWSSGWETLKPTTVSPTPPALQKPSTISPTLGSLKPSANFASPMVAIDPPPKRVVPEKKATGGLKLTTSKPKPAVDDIDSLLGIKPSISGGSGSPSVSARSTNPSTTGWGDFSNTSHRKDDDWGADLTALAKPLAMASLGGNKDKATRRNEAATRNETRRKDMTEKKTKRIASKPATNTSNTLEGFEDW